MGVITTSEKQTYDETVTKIGALDGTDVSVDTSGLNLSSVDVQSSVEELSANHDSLVKTVGKLDSAQGDVVYDGVLSILTSSQKVDINFGNQSSNTDVFEIDDANNEMIFKVAGNYTLMSTVIFRSNTSSSVNITASVNNTNAGEVMSSSVMTIDVGNNTTTQPITLNSLIVISEDDVNIPYILDINTIADNTGIDLLHYSSIITVNQTSAQSVTVENVLNSNSTVNALSANMGREIYDKTIIGSY